MRIKNSKILVIGGWGLVGAAICKQLMKFNPSELIVTSLRESEAKEAVADLENQFKNSNTKFTPLWGNIFTRKDWKDVNPSELFNSEDSRNGFINDVFADLDDSILNHSALYNFIKEHKPDAIIDCVNTATAIAYLNVYKQSNNVLNDIETNKVNSENIEKLIASSYIPQLIRHVQILHSAMTEFDTEMYLKIGTTGTGGMGMNIPYTHSEERPSRVLMSKTAVAGAQTMLMYLLARTPNSTIVKEIKPAATIAWKRIAHGNVKKGGKEISLFDMNPDSAISTEGSFLFDNKTGVEHTDKVLNSVFIDTGENGIFSKGEFEAISALGQMELVTPEEIAEYAVFEMRGGNTGKDIIQGIDAFALGPTYRGGYLRNEAVKRLNHLESETGKKSVAFELLGPPRLSKLLHEANLIGQVESGVKNILNINTSELTRKVNNVIETNSELRSQILSIGLPILLDKGKYLRGDFVKIPVQHNSNEIEFTQDNINQFCYDGWIDLREENLETWKNRLNKIVEQAESVPSDDTSSGPVYDEEYWNFFNSIEPGKIAGWIFEHEDNGWRFKR
ncbi:MAG: polysaccharide biosynthesis protein [Chlorobiota bacterium]